MGATILHTPELRIDEQESAILAKAINDVLAAYGVFDLTDKQLATSQAIMAALTVYGPRAIAIWNRGRNKPRLVPFPVPQQQAQHVGAAPVPPVPTGNPVVDKVAGAVNQPPQRPTAPDINPGFISSRQFGTDSGTFEAISPS